MKIHQEIHENSFSKPLALSIGMFDGVHLGHQKIIDYLVQTAQEKDLDSAILTFWPHPRLVFNPDDSLKLLNTIEEKTEKIEALGVQHLILQEFDTEFRNLSAEAFITEFLINKLNVKHLIVGYDHTFGKGKTGNYQLLEDFSKKHNYIVEEISALQSNNKTVSSTKIRKLLEEGNIPLANHFLGYSYSVSGEVVHGKKLGRTIGYPTANVAFDPIKLLPKKGAYITSTTLANGKKYPSMTSIGTNPTVNGTSLTLETNIIDFEGDLYGQDITVNFHEYLHEEIKFDGLDGLIAQLKKDEETSRSYFKMHPLS